MRVYAGVLRAGDEVRLMPRDVRERVSRMFRLHAEQREEVTETSRADAAPR
ncbi:MAG: hypothetical protein KIT84_00215 [Labilithrix sp.]|nr:hypothetical protein [Labilithrix sp.]MCW5809406.1 hypothetical protein [Labilithrix sp.]